MSNILIVDDDFVMVKYMGIMLSRLGFQFESVSSGHDALDYLKNNTPDIMLIDISLQDVMSGLELVQILNKDEKTKGIYKIAVSAHIDESSSQKYIDAGFNASLKKPFSPQELKDILKAFI